MEGNEVHLIVLVVAIAPRPPISEVGYLAPGWIEERERLVARLKHQVEEMKEKLNNAGVPGEIDSEIFEVGAFNKRLSHRAQYADLTLIGPGIIEDKEVGGHVMSAVLFDAERPVLLLPAGTKGNLNPKRVLVAWNSTVESSRAVREAMEILQGAEAVNITLVDPDASESMNGAEPGADIAAYLARHGVKVIVDRLPSEGERIEKVLARHATDLDADMIVMGAWGHSR
ncbi:universal stress protein, partial [Paracoccus sp. TK19116]